MMHIDRRRLARLLLIGVVAIASSVGARAEKVNKDTGDVAVHGYDLVGYFTESRPVKGDSRFEHRINGARYLFASAANRDLFAKDPAAYLPQYGGFCAYGVSKGETPDIDPQAWKIVDGKLYLNYSPKVQKIWEGDIPGYVVKADRNWPKLNMP